MFIPQIKGVSDLLLRDHDAMVQKGLGWLLREMAKHNAPAAIPYLRKIRTRAPRLVLRTACETLTLSARNRILAA
jgi:3-methyladenine DNA glycosylase AlkD